MAIKREYLEIEVSKLKDYGKNNKVHTDYNVDEIVKSIQRNTYITPIIIDEKNCILAGHGRKLALSKLWQVKAQVLKITWLSEDQKKDFRIADNKLAELSEWNFDNLKDEMVDLWGQENLEIGSLFMDISNDNNWTSLLDQVEKGAFSQHLSNKTDLFSLTLNFPRSYQQEIERFCGWTGKAELTEFILNHILQW